MKKKAPLTIASAPSAEKPFGAFLDQTLSALLLSFVKGNRIERAGILQKERVAMMRIRDALSLSLEPAGTDFIQTTLWGLMLHYPVRPLTDEERAGVLVDWITDLGEFPEDVIFAVCQQWRRGSNSYAPTPGHLLELAEPILKVRRIYHTLVSDALAAERRVVDPSVENKRLIVG